MWRFREAEPPYSEELLKKKLARERASGVSLEGREAARAMRQVFTGARNENLFSRAEVLPCGRELALRDVETAAQRISAFEGLAA